MGKSSINSGLGFYNLLNESDVFTAELGKVTLASGKLEAELILLLIRNKIKGDFSKSTLGSLINLAYKNSLITSNEKIAFEMILKQRNYITHNIYALFIGLVDETMIRKGKSYGL